MTAKQQPGLIAIVGAPRSGTTSLATWLSNHPSVSFSAVKEPHFFSQHDLTGMDTVELRPFVQERYLDRYFADAPRGSVLAEGSVTYLYVPEQMEPILRLWPDARFVIALRDPIDMLQSLHRRLLFIGDETVEDFASAWRLSELRAQGKKIPRSCVDPRFLRYHEAGRLGHYVDRMFKAVGRDRCHVVLFDDLRSNPREAYRDLLSFLSLAHDGRTDFRARRQGYGYRSGTLQRLLKRPPIITRRLLAGEKYRVRVTGPSPVEGVAGRKVLSLRKKLLEWNRAPLKPQSISADLRNEISATLRDDIQMLSGLIGRDLSHWLQSSGPQPVSEESPPSLRASTVG